MNVLKVTSENFDSEVTECAGTVLLDFFAPWCGPCRMLSPVLEEIAEENGEIKVCKINVDDEAELARRFNVTSIPTLVVIKDGKELRRSVGYKPKEDVLLLV